MAREQRSTAAKQLSLPVLIFGLVEVHRLQREVESLEDFLVQANLRTPGKAVSMPKTSRLLDAIATDNGMNLLQEDDRTRLKAFLEEVVRTAPSVHISFASDPSAAFMAKIVEWLRQHIHPFALVQLGLQPTIAAGCIVRTANKTFDFSLRNRFSEQRQVLIDTLAQKGGPA